MRICLPYLIWLQDKKGELEFEGDYQNLLGGYNFQKKELMETRIMLEELKRENQAKSRECQEAWKSLKELQNELMRKSMHVGSLGMEISYLPVWRVIKIELYMVEH